MKVSRVKKITIVKAEMQIADYSAMELRIAASKCASPLMLDFFNIGTEVFGSDFHSFSATNLYRTVFKDPEFFVQPKELNGEPNELFTSTDAQYRSKAKILSFKILFGGTATTLMQDFGIEEEEDMQDIIDSYFITYPELRAMLDCAAEDALRTGYIKINSELDRRFFIPRMKEYRQAKREAESHFGDAYKRMSAEDRISYKEKLYEEFPHIKGLWRTVFSIKNKYTRASYNYPIQGTGADIMKKALCYLHFKIATQGIRSLLMIHNVHDEALTQSPEFMSEKAGDTLVAALEQGGASIIDNIKMTAAAEIGLVWSH